MKTSKIIFEVVAAAAGMIAVNLLFLRGNIGFIRVIPHPYWLPVLFFSVKYGIKKSTAVAFLFGTMYLVLFYHSPFCLDLEHVFEFEIIILPIAFIAGAYGVSQSIDRRDQVINHIKKSNINQKHRIESLEKTIKLQEDLHNEYEKKVSTNKNTARRAYRLSKVMNKNAPGELLFSMFVFFKQELGIKKCVFYRLKDKKELLPETVTGGESLPKEKLYPPYPYLVQKAFETNTPVWKNIEINNKDYTPSTTDDEIICALPIPMPSEGFYGIIFINDMEFLSYNRETMDFIKTISEWLASSFKRIADIENRKRREIFDPDTGCFKFAYMEKMLGFELESFKRYGRKFSLIGITYKLPEEFKKEEFSLLFQKLIEKSLRSSDLLSLGQKNNSYVVFLPGTDSGGAEAFLNKLKSILHNFFRDKENLVPLMNFETASPEKKDKDVESLFKRAGI